MVFIKRLEVRGFKSFGPRGITLNLEPGLVVFTGPNGSGKSNVVDAILFCLGDSSLRRLRVSRLSALLHSSAGRTVESCRVTLTFDNRDRLIPVDSENVTITRELNAAGESRFYLNGKHVPKSVIDELLTNCMLSPGGVWVVLQGTVTRISDLNPDDRRRLLEDLAGVSRFEEKRLMAARQLEEADRKLEYHRGQVGIRREQLIALEEQRNDRLRLKTLERTLAYLRAGRAQKEMAQLADELSRLQESLAETRQKQESARERLDQLSLKIKEVEEERARLLGSIFEGGGGPAEVSFRLSEAQALLDRLQREEAELRSELEDCQRQLTDLEAHLQNSLQEKARLTAELRQTRQELAAAAREKRGLEASLRQVEARWREAQRRLESLLRTEERLRGEITQVEAKLREREPRVVKMEAHLASLRERLDKLRAKEQELSQAQQRLERAYAELRGLVDEVSRGLGEKRREAAALVARVRGVIDEVSHAFTVAERANQWLMELAAVKGGSWGAERRVEEAFRKILGPRFLGRLVDQISYPRELGPAVLAALGPWAEAFVFEDMEAVVSAGQLARKLKVRGIKLVPLEGHTQRRFRPLPRVDGVLGYLLDHVSGPGKGILTAILGDVLLCASPRAAFEVAAQGFTGVTTTGVVFDSKGPLLLGSSISATLPVEPDSELLGLLDRLKRGIARRWSHLLELVRGEARNQSALVERAMEVGRLRSELSLSRRILAQTRARKKAVEREVQRAMRIIDQFTRRLEAMRTSMDRLGQRRERLRAQMEQLEVESTREHIRSLEEERGRLLAAIESASARLYELKGRVNLKLAELGAQENTTKTLSEERRRLQAILSERRAQLQALADEISRARAELERVRRERDAALEAARRVQPQLVRFDEELKSYQSARDEALRTLSRLDREVLSLERRIEDVEGRIAALRSQSQMLGYPEPLELPPGFEQMLEELEAEARELQGRVNMGAEEEYRSLYEGYRGLSQRLNQLEEERSAIVNFIREVEEEKKRAFMDVFTKIDREIRRVFAQLTGGEAWLELEDPDDVFTGGVFLMARLPGREARESTGLSGGERTSAALAFVLAVQSVYPAPLSIMDEVDAHLDAVNLQRLADVLKERAAGKQLIVVSLKDVVAAKADMLVGMYSVEGVSQAVRYRPRLEAVRIG
jgi:chromosome segregation protein